MGLSKGSFVQNVEDGPWLGAPQAQISRVSAFDSLGLDPQNGAGGSKLRDTCHNGFLTPQPTQGRQIDSVASNDTAHLSAGFQDQREHPVAVS